MNPSLYTKLFVPLRRMPTRAAKYFDDVARIFQTPFAGLPVVMWFYFVFSHFALVQSPIWRGNLPDSDDYTYLSQTLDWLQGQSWFDNVQHRMSPPEGVAIHYTRFVEMPIAGVIMLFRLFHYSWRGAAMLGALILPVAYLGVLFAALRSAAARLMEPEWAGLTAFVVMFSSTLLFKFSPGQVDHHGVEAILTITALGLTVQTFARPDQMRWALAAGAALALSTAIALEVLPWMALTAMVVGLWTVASGAKAARSAAAFGLSLAATGVVLLALDKPMASILQPDLLAYSIAYVALMGGIALALVAAAGATVIQKTGVRFIVAGGIAVILGAVYLRHYPALLAGPYGAMDKRLAALLFANLQEAVPLSKRFPVVKASYLVIPPMVAFVASLFFTRAAQDYKKWGWFLMASLLSAALSLTIFYQVRVLIYAQLFAVIPLASCVERGWAWIAARHQGRRRFWAEIGLVLAVGPLMAIFLPAVQDGRAFNTGMLLFPAQSFDASCEINSVAHILNAPPYAGRKLRLMNMTGQGSELLFSTPHEVMAAPYHTNLRGNMDSIDFFSTTDAAQAEKIARRDQIDLVVLCRNIPDMYLQGKGPHYVSFPDGGVRMVEDASLAGQLNLHKAPAWLTEIPINTPTNYLLFEVK